MISEPKRLAVAIAMQAPDRSVTAVVESTALSQALTSKHLKLPLVAGGW